MMRILCCLACFFTVCTATSTGFIVIGDADQPVAFRIQPLTYQGQGISPAIEIENILVAELSSSGLFYQPWKQPKNIHASLTAWRFAGIRYLISGHIKETDKALVLTMTVEDTMGTTPTAVYAELNTDVWQQATQVFAQQLFYSLFYATYTDEPEAHYLSQEDRAESTYFVHLVQAMKSHWYSQVSKGNCQVNISQFPGGSIQSYAIKKGCHKVIAKEINGMFGDLESLPYAGFQQQFLRHLTVRFVAAD